MLDEKWRAYAKTWSQPAPERDTALNTLVVDDVTYADPNSKVSGRTSFSAHMADFQKDFPGARFEIIDVKAHHDRTLANWRLRGQDGSEMMLGTSFATLADDGKFTSFTGFF